MAIKKNIKVIIKNTNKYVKQGFFRAKFIFTKYYETLSIEDDLVLIQSYDGSSISGNAYYLLKELCEDPQYSKYKKVVVVRKGNQKRILKKINEKQWENVELVTIHSKEYCQKLACAKFIINNSTFPTYFIKREGQIYLNTWHGTPLKTLGRQIKAAPNEIGNTQRNFIIADFLLYPNEFTFNVMKRDYMIENLFKGKYILAGYPRNSAFFNEELKEEIIEKYNLAGKKIIAYMPTWKGSLETKNTDEQMIYVNHALYEMENKLDDNTIVFVKLHNYVKKHLNLKKLHKIKVFPEEYETYEFLNVADCLVTDYSSVMWDFANTGKKIVLYAYDLEKYNEQRGMYIDFEKLPFCLTYNTKELIEELNDVEKYNSYIEEIQDIIKYDGKDAASKICDYIFNNNDKELNIINGDKFNNGKKNVLLFSGALNKNGITTAFRSLVNRLNKDEEFNYIITFFKRAVNKNKEYIKEFKNNDYIVIQGQKNMKISEAFAHFFYFKCNIKTKWILNKIDTLYLREIKRIYPNMKIDYAINFSGYESSMMHILSRINAKKIIWAHNNMYKEEKNKRNFHKNSLKYAYNNSDKIVVVRNTMKEELEKYVDEKKREKIVVVHNLNDIELIKELSQKEVEFQDDTFCNVEKEKLIEILENDNINKFINIARFSKEKGIDRLIEAFNNYREKNDESAYLIIIGGYGKEFKKILEMVRGNESISEIKNVIIIKSLLNPYPILNKCNAFVLSSLYEGLPMTIMEALILGKIVISTNITGPKEFLEEGYGYLVENSTEGIIKGLKDYKEGKIDNLKIFDAKKFNEDAEKEFYEMLYK